MDGSPIRPVRRTLNVAECTLILLALLLLIRRGLNGPTQPIGTPTLLATAAAVSGLTVIFAYGVAKGGLSTNWLDRWTPLLAGSMVGLALTTIPGSNILASSCFWGIVLASEVTKRWLLRRVRQDPDGSMPVERNVEPSETDVEDNGRLPIHVSQRILRFDKSDGTESLVANLRCRFPKGQRAASLHVSFCPPMATLPQILVTHKSGPSASLKVAQTMPFGARVDVRLHEAIDAEQSVVIELVATER